MNVSEELVRQIVQKILEESASQNTQKEDFVKEKDPSGIIKIKTDTVKCERFQQDGVALKDVVTLEEAPRMGCGIMELDHTSFEWTLTSTTWSLTESWRSRSTAGCLPENREILSTYRKILTSISRLLPLPDTPTLYIRQTGSKAGSSRKTERRLTWRYVS